MARFPPTVETLRPLVRKLVNFGENTLLRHGDELSSIARWMNTADPNLFDKDLNTDRLNYNAHSSFLGMNGQYYRATLAFALMDAMGSDAFIETGTLFGETPLLVLQQTSLPVRTCEFLEAHASRAEVVLGRFGNRCNVFHGSSPEFLRRLRASESFRKPFFYLDAHWEKELPLIDELEIILSGWSRYLILIDDFEVPEDTGFGYDTYNGQPIGMDMIRPSLERFDGLTVFLPAYGADQETGNQRGWCLIADQETATIVTELAPELVRKEDATVELP